MQNQNELLQSLVISENYNLSLLDILVAIILPFFLNFIVSYVYKKTQRTHNYSVIFIHSLFLFSSLTSVITLIIGSNLARAFGLIGALSIIRFRNALKSPLDAVYIFWSLAIGMACGTGFYFAALLLTVFTGIFALILHKTNYGEDKTVKTVLNIKTDLTSGDDQGVKKIEEILKPHCKGFDFMNIKVSGKSKVYVYYVKTAPDMSFYKLKEELEKTKLIKEVEILNSDPFAFFGE